MSDDGPPPPMPNNGGFNALWNHLGAITQNGTETSTLADGINYNYNEYSNIDSVNRCLEENLEFNGEVYDLHPNLNPNFLSMMSASQSNFSPPNALGMNAVSPGPTGVVGGDCNFQQGGAITPPPYSPCGAASQPIPSNIDYPGDYNFQIYMGQHAQTVAKSASWTFSSKLNKLYADKDKSFPIQFTTDQKPREQCFIRTMPVFKKPLHVQEVVKRCPNHTGEDQQGLSEPCAKHLLTSQHHQAEYTQDPGTGRLSILMPYEEPQVGTTHTTYLFTFKCTISCVGGMNRRPAMLIFTLENQNGMTLGRRVIEIRPCACPGRDRKNDEAECGKEKRLKEKNKRTKVTSQSTTISQVGAKKRKLNTDDEIFTITVRGRENYEMLRKINEALEMMRSIPPDLRRQPSGIHMHLKKESTRQSNVQNLSSFSNSPTVPMPMLPSFPSFGSMPSFQHIETLPIHPCGADYADSAQPTTSTSAVATSTAVTCNEVSSSQEHSGPFKQEGQHYAQASSSIASWLVSIGCEDCTKHFHDRNIMYLYQLEDIATPQDLVDMGIPEEKRDTIRRAIIVVRSGDQLNLSSTPTIQTGSSISSSMRGSDFPGFIATRFTLKQTFSFKVEDEEGDEEPLTKSTEKMEI